jgi:hypothetical protein
MFGAAIAVEAGMEVVIATMFVVRGVFEVVMIGRLGVDVLNSRQDPGDERSHSNDGKQHQVDVP